MKYYIDEQGNRYRVDRETGEHILIQATGSEAGEAGTPESTGEPTETDEE